jgi:iron transport multicopper oxidase
MGQYPDGLRQALVVQDPSSPYAGRYDAEAVITVSDWYHDLMSTLLPQFISYKNPTGAEPVPNAALMNDTSDFQLSVQPGLMYLLRFVNVGAFASQYIWIEGHMMRIIEVDGTWVEEAETDMIYLASAQRCSVLVTMKNVTSGGNFPIVGSMDTVSRASGKSLGGWRIC